MRSRMLMFGLPAWAALALTGCEGAGPVTPPADGDGLRRGVVTAASITQGVTDDAWDVGAGTVVTASSSVRSFSTNAERMFGSVFGTSTLTLFADGRAGGTVHWVEWQSPAPRSITRFSLHASHDGHTTSGPVQPLCGPASVNPFHRDARQRGFDRFTLKAWNPATSAFDIVLYDQTIPLGDDNGAHPGEDAFLYDPMGLLGAGQELLVLAEAVPVVATTRWRAEFRQFGCASGESGPRIMELDGFEGAPDRDGDGVPDDDDAFPDDPLEWSDNDGDGIGDNADPDDDDDGQSDADEIACGSDPLDGSSTSPDADADDLPDCVDPDDDNDGVPDVDDAVPFSDTSPTVVIDGDDTEVANQVLPDGTTFNDAIAACAEAASTHGDFVSCVAEATRDWLDDGLVSGQERGRIQSAAARAELP